MFLSSLRRLSAAVLIMVPLVGSAVAKPLPSLERSHDYRIPSPTDPRERVTTLPVSSAKAFGNSERVAYVGFDGKTYELNGFRGRYVEILLPDAWLGPQALSEAEAQHFVDRTDIIYQNFVDLLGWEPAGDGLLPIAVLPTVCGGALGCGSLGLKGIEMADEVEIRSLVWQQIKQDDPSGVLIHELTHNFDLYWPDLGYVSDYPHGWTTFITSYYFAYTHEGFEGISPEDETRDALNYTSYYFNDPTATWERCVRDDQCQDHYILAVNTYGGFGLRVALRYGPRSVMGFAAFLRKYQQSHEPPATAEEKNDLYVEALAAGAHLNLSCVADSLKWPVSDELRLRMKKLYGARNPDCEDQDHDGYTPLQGDCDDHRSALHPGVLDRPNHLDDDCNGIVDDRSYRGMGDNAQILTLPSEARGSASFDTQDTYQFHLNSPDRILIQFCYEPRINGVVLFHSPTSANDSGLTSVGEGCFWSTFNLGAGDWRVSEGLNSETPVDYILRMRRAEPWPVPPWSRTSVPAPGRQQWILKAPTALSHLPVKPTAIRFWVSGQGYVGTVPYRRDVSFAWKPPAGVDPIADGLIYRAEVVAEGAPAYGITPPRAFVNP